MKIYLLGYMGSGKTTVGKKLASELGISFSDLDAEIEKKEGRKITEIFFREGEKYFRDLESSAIRSMPSNANVVVATGGGTPCFNRNIEFMNENGITVYLKMSVDTLMARLVNSKHERPLLENKTREEMHDYISKHLAEREAFYSQAKYKVKAKDLDVKELAKFLKGELVA